jgi:hypothetical protein
MTGLKHDLLTNASAAVCTHAAEWVLDRLKTVGTAVTTAVDSTPAKASEGVAPAAAVVATDTA